MRLHATTWAALIGAAAWMLYAWLRLDVDFDRVREWIGHAGVGVMAGLGTLWAAKQWPASRELVWRLAIAVLFWI